MREHPLPQDVTGYQFHIVGNMTLKQFVEIGVGCVIGFFIYTTNLLPFIKWPLIGVTVAMGAFAAFIPFEERPFDHWIITFFKVIYKPTKFFWKRKPKIPDYFLYESKDLPQLPVEVDLTPARRQRIHDFITSINQATPEQDPYEEYVQQRAGEIISSFAFITAQQTQIVKRTQKPTLTVRVRDLMPEEKEESVNAINPVGRMTGMSKKALAASQVAANIAIPTIENVGVQRTSNVGLNETETNVAGVSSGAAYIEPTKQTAKLDEKITQTIFNTDLPFPSTPTQPNKPVGMVLGPNNELLAGAIVEITTTDGVVVRAVKSNSLGQFFITTPLQNGNYIMRVEKDGFNFDQQQLNLNNQILKPIEVRARMGAQ